MPKQDLIFNPGVKHGVLVPFGARHPIRLLSKSCCSYSFGLKVIPPLPVSLGEHLKLLFPTSLLSLRLCYTCAHMGMHTWVYTFTRSTYDCNSSCRSAAEAPPLLLGPCASPLSHSCSGYRPSHPSPPSPPPPLPPPLAAIRTMKTMGTVCPIITNMAITKYLGLSIRSDDENEDSLAWALWKKKVSNWYIDAG